MNETVWKHEEKKWQPRNKQAALIIRRANPLLLHTPPPEPSKREPTLKERLAAESKIRLARIAAVEQELKERRERRAKELSSKAKPLTPKVWKHMWVARWAKRMAKMRGLPTPTTEQIRKLRQSQPHFGEPLNGNTIRN